MNHNNRNFENNPSGSETPTASAPNRLLTTTEAAAHLGLTVNKLARLRHVNTGPGWVQLGRTIRYISDDLNWWLEQPERVGNKNL